MHNDRPMMALQKRASGKHLEINPSLYLPHSGALPPSRNRADFF